MANETNFKLPNGFLIYLEMMKTQENEEKA